MWPTKIGHKYLALELTLGIWRFRDFWCNIGESGEVIMWPSEIGDKSRVLDL